MSWGVIPPSIEGQYRCKQKASNVLPGESRYAVSRIQAALQTSTATESALIDLV